MVSFKTSGKCLNYMRRVIPFFFLLSIVVSGCDSFNNKLNFKIHNEFTIEIPFVHIPEDTLEFAEFHFDTISSFFMDPSLDKYRDNILDIELDDVLFQINGYSKSVDLKVTNFQIKIVSGSFECSWNYTGQFWSKDYFLSLGDDNGQFEVLSQILNSHEDLILYLSGIVENTELNFTVSLIIESTISAED